MIFKIDLAVKIGIFSKKKSDIRVVIIKNANKIKAGDPHTLDSFLLDTTSDIKLFVQGWNEAAKEGIEASNKMWVHFNSIQKRWNNPLYTRQIGKSPHTLVLNDDLLKLRIIWEKTFPFTRGSNSITEELLKLLGLIEGCSRLTLWERNPTTGNPEIWMTERRLVGKRSVLNSQNNVIAKFLKSNLFEQFITKSSARKVTNIKTKLPTILNRNMEKVLKEDFAPGLIFSKVFRLKVTEDELVNFLEKRWFEYSPSIKDGGRKGIADRIKHAYFKNININDEFYETKINKKFRVHLVDLSKTGEEIKKQIELLSGIKRNDFTTDSEWYKALKRNPKSEGINLVDLSDAIQNAKARKISSEYFEISFDDIPKNHRFSDNGKWNEDSEKFFNEDHPRGNITGFAGAIVENQTGFRDKVTNLSRRLLNFDELDLSKNVVSDITTAKDTSSLGRLAVIPDTIIKLKGTNLGLEIYQYKVMRNIGGRLGSKGLSQDQYVLDWLKNIGEFDVFWREAGYNSIIKNIQIEFIPAGKTVDAYTKLGNEHNQIIVSYWGEGNEGLGRFGEILNALKIGKQKKRISIDLLEYTMRELEKATDLGVQASMDGLSKQILTHFHNIAKQKTVHNFLRLSVLEILEKYGSKLFTSPGSFYPEISKPQDSKEAI